MSQLTDLLLASHRGGWPFRNPPNVAFKPNKSSTQWEKLAGWWPTVQGGGNILQDYSGFGNHGVFTNVTRGIDSKIGRTLYYLDDQYITIPNIDLNQHSFTVSWWHRPDAIANWSHSIGSVGGWGGFLIHADSAQSAYVGVNTGAGRFEPGDITGLVNELNILKNYVFTYNYVGGDANPSVFYMNGKPAASGNLDDSNEAWGGFYYGQTVTGPRGNVGELRIYDEALNAAEVYALQAPETMWELYAPEIPIFYSIPISVGAYSLTADQGSYALTGQAVSPLADRKITAAQGSYSLSGQATALLRGFLVGAAQGSYTLTGQDAGLIVDRTISAVQGSYALSGQDVDLLRGFILAAAQGSYTLSGQDLSLLIARLLTATQGSYTLTGISVTLDYSAITGYTIVAAQGSYNLTGQSAGLLADRTLSAAQGVYVLTGQDANILLGHLIAAEQGGYTLTGQTAGLIADRLLSAAQGSYVISGQTVGILFVLFPNPDNVTFVQFEDRRTFMKQTDPDFVPYQDRRKRG